MRKLKRELIGYDAAESKMDFQNASIKLQRYKQLYKDFSNKAGLPYQMERTLMPGFTRSLAQKARRAGQAEYGVNIVKLLSRTPASGKGYVSALVGTNPNYGKKGFDTNCQRCVPVYELRRRGYNIEALRLPRKNSIRAGYECFENPIVHGLNSTGSAVMSKHDLISGLDSLPDGARAGILFSRKGNRAGHTFVCEKRNGKLSFHDPQNNNGNVVNYLDMNDIKGFAFYRMDNLNINKNAPWHTVAKRSKWK